MKQATLTVLSLYILLSAQANTYYSTNNTSPNSTANWHVNANGTGATPANFNGAGDIFIVQANHTITTTANWTLGGNNAKIIVETGATLKANNKITVDIFQVYDNGKYTHNNNNSTFPGTNQRLLAAASTVEINNWNGSTKLPAGTSWGNLIIDVPGYTADMNQDGSLTSIAGNFIIRSTGSSRQFNLAAGQDYTLTIGGNLIIEGGDLDASSSNNTAADQAIIINGSYQQSGGTFTRTNSNSNVLEVQFNGSNSQFTRTNGTIGNSYINWTVNASKKLTLNDDLAVGFLRMMTVNGILDFATNSVTGICGFSVAAAGKLITSNTQGLGTSLGIFGIITLTTGASYQFDAATTAPFPSWVTSVNATNVTLNADVSFNKNINISGTLDLANGKAIIPTGVTVTVSSGNAIAGSGFGVSKHIVTQVNVSNGTKGYFRMQNMTGTKTIPVGNGTYYMPVTLTVPGASDFSFCVFNGVTIEGEPNGIPFNANMKKTVVDAVWQVNRNSGSGNVTMKLEWPSVLEGPLFQNVADNQIGIAHHGTYWEIALGSGNQSLNTATRTGVNTFSPFGVGYEGQVLPLKWGDIKAVKNDAGVRIDWSSYSEQGLGHYEIERSVDGKNFNTIGSIVAAGNGSSTKDYSYMDAMTMDGIFFYRIKAVDADNGYVYSSIVRININQQAGGISLYPNPVLDKKIMLQLGNLPKGGYELNVYDPVGNLVYRQLLDHSGGTMSRQLQLPASLARGIYTLSVTVNKTKRIKPFIIQ